MDPLILQLPATPQSWNRYAYVQGNPVNWTDPFGLSTLVCKRPLGNLGWGQKTWLDLPWNPLYHTYFCIVNGANNPQCAGQTTDGPFIGKGRPTRPDEDTLEEGRCGVIELDNRCFEDCLRGIDAAPRPFYTLYGSLGTNCQEWLEGALRSCRAACGLLGGG